MKRMIFTACMTVLVMTACKNESSKETAKGDSSSAKPADEAWVPVDSATQMAKMIEYGTPGEMHKMLASWNGTWNGEMTMWNYEGAAPQTTKSTAVNTMAMDGRYQLSKHSANMMGMPFEGMSIMAYDNATKKFSASWIDNMSTGIMNTTGDWNAATKTLVSTGTMPDICRPGKTCAFREVYKVVDDNNHTMEMYGPDPKTGKEYKMMEIKLSRKNILKN